MRGIQTVVDELLKKRDGITDQDLEGLSKKIFIPRNLPRDKYIVFAFFLGIEYTRNHRTSAVAIEFLTEGMGPCQRIERIGIAKRVMTSFSTSIKLRLLCGLLRR